MSNKPPKLHIKLNIENYKELDLGYNSVDFNTLLTTEKIRSANPKIIKDEKTLDYKDSVSDVYFTSNTRFTKDLFKKYNTRPRSALTSSTNFEKIFKKTLITDTDNISKLFSNTKHNIQYITNLFFSKRSTIYLLSKNKTSNKFVIRKYRFISAFQHKDLSGIGVDTLTNLRTELNNKKKEYNEFEIQIKNDKENIKKLSNEKKQLEQEIISTSEKILEQEDSSKMSEELTKQKDKLHQIDVSLNDFNKTTKDSKTMFNNLFKLQEQINAIRGGWTISNGFYNTKTSSIPREYYITIDVQLLPEGNKLLKPSKYLNLFKCKNRAEKINKSLQQLLGESSLIVFQRFDNIIAPIQHAVSNSLDILKQTKENTDRNYRPNYFLNQYIKQQKQMLNDRKTSGGSSSKKHYSTRHTRKIRSNKMSKAKTLRKRC